MKVLLLVDWTYPCDHQFLKHVYAENLSNRGHDITWVMRPMDDQQNSTSYHNWKGTDVYVLPTTAFDPVRNAVRYFTGRIRSNALFDTGIKFSEYDLIHVRNDLPMGLTARTITNQFDIRYAHQISHLKSETLIEKAHQGHGSQLSRIKGHLGVQLRKYVAESSDLILPISDAMKQYLKQKEMYMTPMETLPTGAKIIKNLPDGTRFKKTYNISSEFILLYMGSMSPSRNLEFLFDVLTIVREYYDVELVMVGGRSESNRIRLKQEAINRGVSNRVTFTGWISDRTDIRSAVAAADIGLSPLPTDGILRTNAPIKTLEYMSMRTPVVATATPDQKNVLNISEGGFAVDYEIEPFAEAVIRLLSSRELRAEMGHKAQRYMMENRNFDILSDRVEQIYEELVYL